jgi:hypothetical protein
LRKLSVALFFVALVVALGSQARALTTTFAQKQITVNFTVTPSPTPIGYVPTSTSATAVAAARAARGSAAENRIAVYMFPSNPLDRLMAFVPIRMGDMVAQTPPQGNVKVQFTVKLDPKFANFHIIPHTTSLNAGYGSNTYTCAYEIFAKYTTAWNVTDWVYGSNTTGGTAGLNGFPTYNYPTTSQLSWLAETITTTFKPFANAGGPGEQTFNGAANTSKQVCIDLTLNVPNTVSAGTYQSTIQYSMIVTL